MGTWKTLNVLHTGFYTCEFPLLLYIIPTVDIESPFARMTVAFVDFNGVVPEKVCFSSAL
jgi:hypothetical protein